MAEHKKVGIVPQFYANGPLHSTSSSRRRPSVTTGDWARSRSSSSSTPSHRAARSGCRTAPGSTTPFRPTFGTCTGSGGTKRCRRQSWSTEPFSQRAVILTLVQHVQCGPLEAIRPLGLLQGRHGELRRRYREQAYTNLSIQFTFDVDKSTFALKPMNCPGHCLSMSSYAP